LGIRHLAHILGRGLRQVNEDRLPAIGKIQGCQLFGSVVAEESEGVSRSARIANYVALNGRELVVNSV